MYNSSFMIRRSAAATGIAVLLLAMLGSRMTVRAQQYEKPIDARARVFPDVGRGVRALKRDAAGHYYVLRSPDPAVLVYRGDGTLLRSIPDASAKDAPITFAEDFDVDRDGRVYVADRGANAVKVFSPDGHLVLSVPVSAPTSVVALPEGEFAVAGWKSNHLVRVYGLLGKIVREFGDPTEIAERAELKQFLNLGRLQTDPVGNIYYGFSYLPEPTVRKYDRFGYAAYEISLATPEYLQTSLAARREIERQEERTGAPQLKIVLDAFGVDPETQDVWVALGNELLHFDREGNHRETFRTYTKEGARLEPNAILVEPTRLLLANDPLGIYEFPRPDKPAPEPHTP
jgi:hypothetical protein